MTDDPKTNTPRPTGLPRDIGNEMSDRAGDYTESEGAPTPDQSDYLGSEEPKNTMDTDHSGTTFDAGDVIPGR